MTYAIMGEITVSITDGNLELAADFINAEVSPYNTCNKGSPYCGLPFNTKARPLFLRLQSGVDIFRF